VAFQNKAIDASVTTEPSATKAEQLGLARRVAGGDEVFPGQQVAVILYGGQFIRDRRNEALKFMKAYLRGVRDYNDALADGRLGGPSADDIIKILTTDTLIKDPAVYKAIVPNGCNPDGKVNVDSLRKDLDFFRARGLIQGNVTVDQVLDHSVVDAALKELGPYRRKR
jgi:NitT/TauT family transport system substrate-binding protein